MMPHKRPVLGRRTRLSTLVQAGVAGRVRDLVWSSFFAELGRGVSFESHLPWHADPFTQSIALCEEGDNPVAAAILRDAPQPNIVMAGYVCVAKGLRGQGYGRLLMEALNEAVDKLGYQAALLWTSKPAVYVRHGYKAIGRDRFVTVSREDGEIENIAVTSQAWPGASDTSGLPAFAKSAVLHRSDVAMAVLAQGPHGATLIDWSGNPIDIAAILDSVGHRHWSVNLSASDPFSNVLPTDRYAVSQIEGAFTMIRSADVTFAPNPISFLDRI